MKQNDELAVLLQPSAHFTHVVAILKFEDLEVGDKLTSVAVSIVYSTQEIQTYINWEYNNISKIMWILRKHFETQSNWL